MDVDAQPHPHMPDSRRLENIIDSDGVAQLLNAGAQSPPHYYVRWGRESARVFRLALSESRRLEVIHSNGDAHLLDGQ